MRRLLLCLIFATNAYAVDETLTPPSLGSCSPYTDYYIYKCQKFKCKLPVAKIEKTFLQIEVVEQTEKGCVYNYQYLVRYPKYPPTEIKFRCVLSPEGMAQMSNQFTQYKKGNIAIYAQPSFTDVTSKECTRY